MASVFSLIQIGIGCGSMLVLAFLVLLSLPQSKLRAVLMPIVGWTLAIFCGLYCISPIDILPEAMLGPFGFFDDIGAAALGIASALTAQKAGNEQVA
jgi:uncharacterized membrane protein YkvA (DUF1232 family)